ncbi:MAG: PAS domain-containing protein [bacterium]|nr:PAS domain-containing protein [bacterium]
MGEQDEQSNVQNGLSGGPILVGIGASAGGLEALEQFFSQMPDRSGLAFVIIQHLDPARKSIMHELIAKQTPMKVTEVEDGVQVEPNHVYVIPPNRDLAVLQGKLHLMEPTKPRGVRAPIDFFFRSLAQDCGERAICIVLSGTGSEGAQGLKAVKGEGGMVMVQDPESARYDGMPRSAAATGMADYILPPDQMPKQLLAYIRHVATGPALQTEESVADSSELQKILVVLRSGTGHDFSGYKQNTVVRRIERRMAIHQLNTLEEYVSYLQHRPAEVEVLFKELLIEVTRFFRDPEAFELVKSEVFPALLEDRDPDVPVRIWVPGCATGEEAYSLAMLCREYMAQAGREHKIQIFATDISKDSIEKARTGVYPESIAVDVSSERLQRFFEHQDHTYQIKQTVRDMLVFAVQSTVKDPPFSRMDLISCRNMLIYMGSVLQSKVLSIFHYSLVDGGYLLLGSSETLGDASDFFVTVNREWKLFQREKDLPSYRLANMSNFSMLHQRDRSGTAGPSIQRDRGMDLHEHVEEFLLTHWCPACVLVNEKGDVIYIHGHTGAYLEPAAGEANMNLLKMAREGLQLELAMGLRRVVEEKKEIRFDGLQVKANGESGIVNLIVHPFFKPDELRDLVMVMFERGTAASVSEPVTEPTEEQNFQIAGLEKELESTRAYLQNVIAQLEFSNQELRSANEELQSSNEEMQSTNEEMETSREELQSMNEELMTVNSELTGKVEELARVRNDMINLLVSTGIGTIFLDLNLDILRFTPKASQVINLIESDKGRPLSDLVFNLEYPDLVRDAKAVLDSLIPKETEAQNKGGLWFLVRILPYRTAENVIEGVVITFLDIDAQKRAEQRALVAQQYAESIVDTVREALVVLDEDLCVVSANRSFYKMFDLDAEMVGGRLIHSLKEKRWDLPELHQLLLNVLAHNNVFEDFLMAWSLPSGGSRKILLNGRPVESLDGARMILLAIEDITDQRGPQVP